MKHNALGAISGALLDLIQLVLSVFLPHTISPDWVPKCLGRTPSIKGVSIYNYLLAHHG